VDAIVAGYYHTCAAVNGGVQCWGLDLLGELGDKNNSPIACSPPVGPARCSLVPVPVFGLTSGVP
jgi:alpha-tubulin suppressor-like RCC1 family protein